MTDPASDVHEPTDARAAADAFSQPPARVPPEPTRPVRRSGGAGGTILLVLAAIVAIGGVAFAAGRLTAPVATATNPLGAGGQGFQGPFGGQGGTGGNGGNGGQGRPGGQGGGFGGGGFGGLAGGLRGSVTAIDTAGITIQMANGTSLTIPLDSGTTYHRAADAVSGDVAIGTEVQITAGAITRDPSATPGPVGQGFQLGPAQDVLIVGN